MGFCEATDQRDEGAQMASRARKGTR